MLAHDFIKNSKEKYNNLFAKYHKESGKVVEPVELNAEYIISSSSPEIDLMICKDDKFIGYIDGYVTVQGADCVIKKIRVYNDDELSYKLTQKYLGKILILSNYKDKYCY